MEHDQEVSVQEAPRPEEESRRLHELYELDILDTPPEEAFDGLTRIASRLCDSRVSLINLLDADRQWTKSAHGTEITEISRNKSVCQYTILKDEVLEINDLRDDKRFRDAPYVKGDPNYRFYAGAQLVSSNGYALGALCVLDTEKKTLSEEQKMDLKALADEVSARIELRKRQKELEALNQQKSELMSVVSHDMRNPLMGIIGAADFMLDETGETREKRLELVEIIKQSAERLLQIVTELLDSEMVRFQNMQVNPVPCHPAESVREVLRLYEFSAENKQLDLELSQQSSIPEVMIDEQKFTRVIANLVSNAIKFTPRGGRVEVRLDLEGDEDGTLRAVVSDTGIGIPKDELSSLFERREGDGRAGTDNESSYGLGLYIVKQLVDVCGAEISVDSRPGEGTSITVVFPAEKV